MFLKNFIKSGLMSAIGNMPDYWIILNAAGWLDKGVLEQADLVEIQNKIDSLKVVPEEESIEEGEV